jgi:bifunctional DNA-binding transcriptional regulator/antitoxin component of YhaV-PrlF toxin-antitoxin module
MDNQIGIIHTGIVRKTDALNRLTLPKEFERSIGLHNGCSIDIAINQNRQIVLTILDPKEVK